MNRSTHSLRAKWKTLSRDAYLWISCKKLVEEENRTGNFDEEILRRMTHARKANSQKPVNVQFKYVEATELLETIDKFGDVMRGPADEYVRYDRFSTFRSGGRSVSLSDVKPGGRSIGGQR